MSRRRSDNNTQAEEETNTVLCGAVPVAIATTIDVEQNTESVERIKVSLF